MMLPRVRPLKRFGQNFLVDSNIKSKILKAVHAGPADHILEIGPGRGALTFDLARTAAWVYGVEIDRGLYARLSLEANNHPRVTFICADILKFDLKRFVLHEGVDRVRVVSNLPYYITTPVLEYLFEKIDVIEDIFITIQREVADRLTAKAGSPFYGSLSCFVDYHCESCVMFRIPPSCFRPVPKVDSAFVRLTPRPDRQGRLGLRSEDLFFKLIRTSFGQRRKTLRASLSGILDKAVLKGLGIDEFLERRPQTLSLQEFALLSNRVFDFLGGR